MPKSKHIYFIGIGGAALNGIAQVLAARGYTVSGSDLVASPVTERLQQQGITVHIGQAAAHITPDIDEVIISSAVTGGPGAVEVARAQELKLPVYKRTVWWSRLMSEAKVAIAVAGTHGKTSTTAMIGVILAHASLDPTVLVGGEVPDFGGTVRLGSREVIVVEADEYDRAFHATRPTHAVITTIDYDHPDTYPTPDDYRRSFRKFARLVKRRQGLIVACGDDPTIRRALAKFQLPIRWYGGKNLWPGLKLIMPGDHMRLNATAAAKVCHEVGISKRLINEALAGFKGVGRRFELIGDYRGIPVYDDYAHHPAEIRATIEAARSLGKHPAVLFQPHQRVRTKQFLADFAHELSTVKPVGIMPLFQVAGREADIAIASDDLVKLIPGAVLVNDEDITQFMKTSYEQQAGLILVLGAGDISAKVRTVLKADQKI